MDDYYESKRRTEQEQYDIIMECRQSRLSDYQWCLEHNINPGTFYNWVCCFFDGNNNKEILKYLKWLIKFTNKLNNFTISTPFLLHSILKIFAISCFIFLYATFLLYLGAKTIWYLHFHFVCDKLLISIWITSFDFMWLANQHNYITGVFLLFTVVSIKQCWLIGLASGLFVHQSSVSQKRNGTLMNRLKA